MFPILNSCPTSLPIPSLWVIPVHQPRAPCIMHRTWTGNSFHMIIYIFQCQSPKSPPLGPLPQSPKVCSIHLCLFCCLAYRVIVTIFLNSIYMHYYTVPALPLHLGPRRPWGGLRGRWLAHCQGLQQEEL